MSNTYLLRQESPSGDFGSPMVYSPRGVATSGGANQLSSPYVLGKRSIRQDESMRRCSWGNIEPFESMVANGTEGNPWSHRPGGDDGGEQPSGSADPISAMTAGVKEGGSTSLTFGALRAALEGAYSRRVSMAASMASNSFKPFMSMLNATPEGSPLGDSTLSPTQNDMAKSGGSRGSWFRNFRQKLDTEIKEEDPASPRPRSVPLGGSQSESMDLTVLQSCESGDFIGSNDPPNFFTATAKGAAESPAPPNENSVKLPHIMSTPPPPTKPPPEASAKVAQGGSNGEVSSDEGGRAQAASAFLPYLRGSDGNIRVGSNNTHSEILSTKGRKVTTKPTPEPSRDIRSDKKKKKTKQVGEVVGTSSPTGGRDSAQTNDFALPGIGKKNSSSNISKADLCSGSLSSRTTTTTKPIPEPPSVGPHSARTMGADPITTLPSVYRQPVVQEPGFTNANKFKAAGRVAGGSLFGPAPEVASVAWLGYLPKIKGEKEEKKKPREKGRKQRK